MIKLARASPNNARPFNPRPILHACVLCLSLSLCLLLHSPWQLRQGRVVKLYHRISAVNEHAGVTGARVHRRPRQCRMRSSRPRRCRENRDAGERQWWWAVTEKEIETRKMRSRDRTTYKEASAALEPRHFPIVHHDKACTRIRRSEDVQPNASGSHISARSVSWAFHACRVHQLWVHLVHSAYSRGDEIIMRVRESYAVKETWLPRECFREYHAQPECCWHSGE